MEKSVKNTHVNTVTLYSIIFPQNMHEKDNLNFKLLESRRLKNIALWFPLCKKLNQVSSA